MKTLTQKVKDTAADVPPIISTILAAMAAVGGLLVTDKVVSSSLEQATFSFLSVVVPAAYILATQIKAGHKKQADAQLRTALAMHAPLQVTGPTGSTVVQYDELKSNVTPVPPVAQRGRRKPILASMTMQVVKQQGQAEGAIVVLQDASDGQGDVVPVGNVTLEYDAGVASLFEKDAVLEFDIRKG
jgi:hypothetical protein